MEQMQASLSMTRCSQEVVLSRTVQMKETGLARTTSTQGLVPGGRECCRGGVPRQRYAQTFLPLLQWSSSISAGCFADSSFDPASLRRRSNPGPNRPLSCREMPMTPTPPFASPYLFVFARSACAAAGASSCPIVSLKSSEEPPRRRL